MGKRVAHNKLTQEQVIEQFHEVHGDEFDYSNVEYVDTHTKIEVRCKKHNFIFYPTPKNHKNGAKCTMCGREAQIQKVWFSGYTECYAKNSPIQEIINL